MKNHTTKMKQEMMGRLFEDATPSLLTTATRICQDSTLAEDLVSETLLRVLRSCETYREDMAFKTWCTRILINTYLDHCRMETSRQKTAARYSQQQRYNAKNRNSERLKASLLEDIAVAISKLEPDKRELIECWLELADHKSPSLRELAQNLGWTRHKTTKVYKVAIQELKAALR